MIVIGKVLEQGPRTSASIRKIGASAGRCDRIRRRTACGSTAKTKIALAADSAPSIVARNRKRLRRPISAEHDMVVVH